MVKKKRAGLKYVGSMEWIPGVPTRDLTPEEADRYREVIDATQANIGRVLYIPIEESPDGDQVPEDTGE